MMDTFSSNYHDSLPCCIYKSQPFTFPGDQLNYIQWHGAYQEPP